MDDLKNEVNFEANGYYIVEKNNKLFKRSMFILRHIRIFYWIYIIYFYFRYFFLTFTILVVFGLIVRPPYKVFMIMLAVYCFLDITPFLVIMIKNHSRDAQAIHKRIDKAYEVAEKTNHGFELKPCKVLFYDKTISIYFDEQQKNIEQRTYKQGVWINAKSQLIYFPSRIIIKESKEELVTYLASKIHIK